MRRPYDTVGLLVGCLASASLGSLGGCENSSVAMVDGGVARQLEILDPPGSQIGLRYASTIDLPVRYFRDDASSSSIANEPVHFAIFDDPVGSTLSRDVVDTNDDGVAIVTLTAGAQEGSFRIRASAGGAADVDFAISVSELEFVDMQVVLVDPLPAPGMRTLIAALYESRACATLAATSTFDTASRTLSQDASASTTLHFVNLLSRSYAVVGEVEDAGKVVAYGCLDVDQALVPPGAQLSLPVTLRATTPSITGSFDVTSSVATARQQRSDGLFADYDILDRCDGHLGQLLLDELVSRLSMTSASEAATHRGPTAASTVGSSTVACRPAQVAAVDSLDHEMGALTSLGTAGAARGDLLADLDSILGSGAMASRMTIASTAAFSDDDASSPQRFVTDHEALSVALSIGAAVHVYDLASLGLPVLGQSDIAATLTGSTFELSTHDLPIALPALWGTAFSDLSIATRLPTLADQTPSGWVSAVVAAAQRNGKMGCAAIEDLLCAETNPTGCTGTLLTICAQATTAVGVRLSNPFTQEDTLTLSGSATAIDDNGDQIADRLYAGSWTASGTLTTPLTFSGARTP